MSEEGRRERNGEQGTAKKGRKEGGEAKGAERDEKEKKEEKRGREQARAGTRAKARTSAGIRIRESKPKQNTKTMNRNLKFKRRPILSGVLVALLFAAGCSQRIRFRHVGCHQNISA